MPLFPTSPSTPKLLHLACAPIAGAVLHPWRIPPFITPGMLGLPYRRLRLESHGAGLAAWYVPHPDSRRGIVLCHGHDDSRLAFTRLLRPLHQAGFHLLAFDFRAMGLSSGEYCTYGHTERLDVLTALNWMRENTAVDHLGLYGISMGGSAAILAAAQDPSVEAVVTDCAFARLADMVHQRFRVLPAPLRAPVAGSVRAWAEHWAEPVIDHVNPELALRTWKPRPLLLIHGARDGLTPVQHAHRLAAAAGALAEVWIVPGAFHARARYAAGREYAPRLIRFFTQNLGGHARSPVGGEQSTAS